jgi:hypothetical protein
VSERQRPLIAGIVTRLLAVTMPGASVSLDTIGEHVGAEPVTYDEIGVIIDALEQAGRHIADPELDATRALQQVLAAARAVRSASGRTPSLQELERATGLDRTAVLTALRFADVLGR